MCRLPSSRSPVEIHFARWPVACLYARGRVRHVGRFDALEASFCGPLVGHMQNGSPEPDGLPPGLARG